MMRRTDAKQVGAQLRGAKAAWGGAALAACWLLLAVGCARQPAPTTADEAAPAEVEGAAREERAGETASSHGIGSSDGGSSEGGSSGDREAVTTQATPWLDAAAEEPPDEAADDAGEPGAEPAGEPAGEDAGAEPEGTAASAEEEHEWLVDENGQRYYLERLPRVEGQYRITGERSMHYRGMAMDFDHYDEDFFP